MGVLWVLVGALILIIVTGAIYQAVGGARDRRHYHLPGRRVDVGGYRLYLHETGPAEGPTVVLLTGSTLPAVTWYPVQRQVARFARVCSYDRAGYGWSDPAPGPRTGHRLVEELHTVLHRASVPGPYVLVGHSLGGMYARLFASRYPAEVAGMVLVDALTEHEPSRATPALRRLDLVSRRLLVLLSVLGLMRLMLKLKPQIIDGGKGEWLDRFPAALHPGITGTMYRPRLCVAALREMAALPAAEAEIRQAGDLGDMPLVVLSRDLPSLEGWGYSPAAQAEIWRRQQAAQTGLARLSTRGVHRIAENSGHLIPLEQPEAVVAAIREVLEAHGATSREHA